MSAESKLSPGVVIAETYEVERLLGGGGVGEVWLAKHRRVAGKQVAIKVLHLDSAAAGDLVIRFRREAEIAARLEHPHIVQVLDFDTLPSGEPYLVMEYLKGVTLAAYARRGQVSLEKVQDIMRQVGGALEAAHAIGVVHRDLKPDNIFLVTTSVGDQVKVLDFGISKLVDSRSLETQESALIGTPIYMSPEQALGLNKEISAQSDVFSLGSIAYELLTGTPPFVADNIARVVFRVAYEPHAPLAALRPDLPESVVSAVEHALQKDRALRTADVVAFVAEFTGRPLGTPPLQGEKVPGLFAPGMEVTESLAGGSTMASKPKAPHPDEVATPWSAAGPNRLPAAANAPSASNPRDAYGSPGTSSSPGLPSSSGSRVAPSASNPRDASGTLGASGPPSPPSVRARVPILAGLGALVTAALAVAFVVTTPSRGPNRVALDSLYAANHEPLPPPACREVNPERLAKLSNAAPHLLDSLSEDIRRTEAQTALMALEPSEQLTESSPESAAIVARARMYADLPPASGSLEAMKCAGFAAADNLMATLALREKQLDEAERFVQAAQAADPQFDKPLFTQSIIRLQRGRVDEAVGLLSKFLERQPNHAEGHYALGRMLHSKASGLSAGEEAERSAARAQEEFCRAADLGSVKGKLSCTRSQVQSEN
jgi:serine/threonine protein kinase